MYQCDMDDGHGLQVGDLQLSKSVGVRSRQLSVSGPAEKAKDMIELTRLRLPVCACSLLTAVCVYAGAALAVSQSESSVSSFTREDVARLVRTALEGERDVRAVRRTLLAIQSEGVTAKPQHAPEVWAVGVRDGQTVFVGNGEVWSLSTDSTWRLLVGRQEAYFERRVRDPIEGDWWLFSQTMIGAPATARPDLIEDIMSSEIVETERSGDILAVTYELPDEIAVFRAQQADPANVVSWRRKIVIRLGDRPAVVSFTLQIRAIENGAPAVISTATSEVKTWTQVGDRLLPSVVERRVENREGMNLWRLEQVAVDAKATVDEAIIVPTKGWTVNERSTDAVYTLGGYDLSIRGRHFRLRAPIEVAPLIDVSELLRGAVPLSP